ncbi:presenilin-associated rhomboid-like protein, mitochondrial [Tubulanus polymorphus]|uniref:presenilin-associated rhomboid-like protein, mitochondrial n=1 Tax=Tubulanus polymorphus TaxID=672921 RepID=UPI003DA5711D
MTLLALQLAKNCAFTARCGFYRNFLRPPSSSAGNNVLSPSNNTVVRTLKRRSITQKSRLAPEQEIKPNGELTYRNLLKPFGFTVAVGACSFGGCMIWQYENLRQDSRRLMHRAFHHPFGKAGSIRQQINMHWNQMSPGVKVVSTIIGLNAGVFLLWRLPRIQPIMMKFFTSNPAKGSRCWSMLLSTFSHYSFFHLAANMYVLWSFSSVVTHYLGKEQFLGFYLTGGVVSSLMSYLAKTVRPSLVPSLGASGAIMAVLGAVCMNYPDAQLSVAFIGDILPHSFSAHSAMIGLLTFDALGLFLGWRLLDHAAHLGGMLFGIWYVSYGHELIWHNRQKLMKVWHSIRG